MHGSNMIFILYFIHYNALCVCVCVLYSSDMMEDEEDDTIHMGNAIMTFYAALIDLLGRCAPEMHVSLKHAQKFRRRYF